MDPTPFFKYAREREAIRQRRECDKQPSPWTDDPILHQYRFCNVYREDDRVTRWFRKHVREPLRDSPDVLLTTVLFRFFNRITTGEAIFQQHGLERRTAWTELQEYGSSSLPDVKRAILTYCGKGPYVTGSYIIKSPNGMDKLTGVLWAVEQFMLQERLFAERKNEGVLGWREVADWSIDSPGRVSLEQMWDWLRKFPYLGDFTAYEIVTDLRHTALLENAPDIYTWANPGPGAMRGLNRLHGRHKDKSQQKYLFIVEMRHLLKLAQESSIWPVNPSGLPVEMRDIEHTLCEFDKYERARLGEGRPRGTYPHG